MRAHARKDPTAHSRYVANQACALFFLLPTCSPWKAFETWGSPPRRPRTWRRAFFSVPSPGREERRQGKKGERRKRRSGGQRWKRGRLVKELTPLRFVTRSPHGKRKTTGAVIAPNPIPGGGLFVVVEESGRKEEEESERRESGLSCVSKEKKRGFFGKKVVIGRTRTCAG